ncbi:histidine kinase [Kordia sp. YSTF-M3]|uniref:Histidine kinase n=1 Tax=Kordia aestuariivivens TaxID=2759037 RepID=A0ABR7QF17_9FLAO|nr:histidine kinase [Kordia aestuariivivens]MBC8757093.1 histidine kinase [Kordia aestuariivivens]
MSKYLSCVFLVFVVIGCQKKLTPVEASQKVSSLQQKAIKTASDSTFYYLQKADKLIQQHAGVSDSLKTENLFQFGLYYRELSDLENASEYFYKATEAQEDSIQNSRQFFQYFVAFETYKSLGKYGDCMTLADSFKRKINLKKDPLNSGHYYFFLEDIYKVTSRYEKALSANKKRIEIIEKNPSLKLTNHQELLSQYNILYYLNRENEGVKILDDLIRKDSLLTTDLKRQVYSSRGIYDFYQGDFTSAISNYKKSLKNVKLLKVFDQNELLANSYSNIAEAYIIIKEYDKARKYLDSAKGQNFEKLPNDYQRNILKYELKLANETQESLAIVETELDRLLDNQNKSYQDKYESELLALKESAANEALLFEQKKNTELKNIRLRNTLFLLFSVLLLFTLGGILYYRNKKLRFERLNLQMQQRLLRSQMNPHFTSNVLYSIQNTIKFSSEEAKKHLVKFSRLLRLILENSTKNYIQFEKEIDALKKYMDFQLIRFPEKFSYTFTYENMEEDDFIFVPPMLLQPFIENSIEHGFSAMEHGGLIALTFTKKDSYILCAIRDNGKGFSDPGSTFKDSVSIKLIADFLKKSTKKEVSIETNTQSETGVLVTLAIPYKLSDEN